MVEQKKVLGLMDYINKLSKLPIREEKANGIITNIVKTLNILKTASSLTYNQIEPLKKEITTSINDEGFKDKIDPVFDSISVKIKNYLDNSFNLLAFKEEEATILADCIIQLNEIINELYSDKEARLLEPQQEKSDEENKDDKDKSTDEKEDLLDDELEEDEEISENVSKFMYECTKCENISKESIADGCTRCGSNLIQMRYIQ